MSFCQLATFDYGGIIMVREGYCLADSYYYKLYGHN